MAFDDGFDALREGADTMEATLGALERSAGAFSRAISTGFRQAAVDGRALDDVLRAVVLRLSSATLDAALAPIAKGISGAARSLSAGLVQAALPGQPVTPFAEGGVISAPAYFRMPGGGTGLAGEAGPEAIMPLSRGADGRLGVSGAGGGAVHVTFNVTSPDAASFARSEAQMTAMLARAVGRGRRGL